MLTNDNKTTTKTAATIVVTESPYVIATYGVCSLKRGHIDDGTLV